MADDLDAILAEWSKRVTLKQEEIDNAADRGLLKCALFCEGEAKKNVMDVVYNTSVPWDEELGDDMWKRTGLLKASIGSGMDPSPHTALVFCTAPYAKYIEYGTGIYNVNGEGRQTPWVYDSNTGIRMWTRGQMAKPFMYPSVFNSLPQIKTILSTYLKEVL
jgi:hypothetical protein